MRSLDLAIILIYLAGITWFGARFRGGQKNLRDYFLGGRTAPWWAISLSIVSAETSTLTIVGTPPLAFAGLYETWTGPNGEEIDTAAIITTRANRPLSAIHDRMPVFVPPAAFDLWLDCANVEADVAAALIAPAEDDLLEAYEVSTAVNRVGNDSAALIEPAAIEAPRIAPPPSTDLFTREKKPRPRKASEPDGQASLF